MSDSGGGGGGDDEGELGDQILEPIERPDTAPELDPDFDIFKIIDVLNEQDVRAIGTCAQQDLMGPVPVSDSQLPVVGMDGPQSVLNNQQSVIAQSSQAQQGSNMLAWLGLICGASSVVLTGIYTVFTGYSTFRANNENAPQPPPQIDTSTIISLLTKWNNLTDDVFWETIGTYIENNTGAGLTLADQVQFMSYIIDMWPLTEPFLFNDAPLSNVVQDFMDIYNAQGQTTGVMYTAMATYTYSGSPLPRTAAATVLRFALALIIEGQST